MAARLDNDGDGDASSSGTSRTRGTIGSHERPVVGAAGSGKESSQPTLDR